MTHTMAVLFIRTGRGPAGCIHIRKARAISRSRESGEIREYYALIQEAHCKGFSVKGTQTVGQWLAGQDVAQHNMNNDKLMELIRLKNSIMPGPLSDDQSNLFYLSLYNLDEFRRQIFSMKLLDGLAVPGPILDKIRTSDDVLLDLGLKWVRYQLFGIVMDEF